MVNQQLLDFIKSQLSKGVDKETIIRELLGSGWVQSDIDEGFSTINTPVINPIVNPTINPVINPIVSNNVNNPILNQTTNNFSKKVLLIIVALFVIAGGASGYYFRNNIPVIKDLIKTQKILPVNEIQQEENTQAQAQTEIVSEINRKTNPNESLGTIIDNLNKNVVGGESKTIIPNKNVVSIKNEDNKGVKVESKTSKITSRVVEIGGEKTTVYNSDSIKIISPSNNAEVKVGDTLDIKVHIADFNKLQSYMFLFQGESIFTKPTSPDMVYRFIVSGEYIEGQSIVALGNFYDGTKSFQSTDAKDIKVTPVEKIKEFNIKPEVMVIEKGKTRRPDYEAIFPTAITQIGETDLIKVVIKDPTFASYDNNTNYFKALSKGETVADITYRGITNHMFINVIQYEEPVGDPIL